MPPHRVVMRINFSENDGPAQSRTAGISFTSPPPIKPYANNKSRIKKVMTAIARE